MIQKHLIIFLRSDGKLTVSFDGAWQKRGTGHAYNSLTGTCTMWSIDT